MIQPSPMHSSAALQRHDRVPVKRWQETPFPSRMLRYRIGLWLLPLIFGLASCNLPRSAETPQPSLNVTLAYQTVEARLTEVAGLNPSTNPSPLPTDSGVNTPTPPPASATSTATTLPATLAISTTPAKSCDQAAAGNPIDVTIPDDTVLSAGQTFTKIWRLQNVGTCAWTRSYAVTFFSGEQMGAQAVVFLPGDVLPGQSVDIAVDMQAPQAAGRYQGNWKLRNANNVLFGIGPNGSAPIWVRIVVVQTVTPTVTVTTPTATTPPSTPTATPPTTASGSATLTVNNALNLDNGQITSSGGDLFYQTNVNGQHLLIPQGSAQFAIYGSSQPGLSNCQAVTMGSSPVIVETLNSGTYFCYRTDQSAFGRARLADFTVDDFSITLDYLTWSAP